MTALVSLDSIEVRIGGRPIVRGARLEVGEGERVALVGRNGIGKTTLLHVVLGLRSP